MLIARNGQVIVIPDAAAVSARWKWLNTRLGELEAERHDIKREAVEAERERAIQRGLAATRDPAASRGHTTKSAGSEM